MSELAQKRAELRFQQEVCSTENGPQRPQRGPTATARSADSLHHHPPSASFFPEPFTMSRAVLQVFEQYQKARVTFVQTVADLSTRPQNVEALQNADVMSLLRPLLLDNVPSIQQSAALALGRLANYNDDLAEAVVGNGILPQLVYSLSEKNRFYKKAAAFVLRAGTE
eukprot:701801-Rhodomonas_salina.2